MFNIIQRRTLLNYIGLYPEAATSLQEWYRELEISEFKNFNELKEVYKNASIVGDDRVVFNIKGNSYRLVVRFVFTYKAIQIKWFGTHNEYDAINVETVQFKTKRNK
jgi:mRNA interferase HigB